MLLSAMAEGICPGPTSSGRTRRNAGPLMAAPMPSTNVSASNSPAAPGVPGQTTRWNVSTPSSAAARSIQICVAISSRRRLTTSATAPAGNASRQMGSAAADCISATSSRLSVNLVMNAGATASCMAEPT